MRVLGWLAALLLLAACAPGPAPAALPSPQVVTARYSPALQPWATRLHACAAEQPALALYTRERSASDLQPDGELWLWLGAPPPVQPAPISIELGQERLQVVVHSGHPLNSLDTASLQALFSGQQADWHGLPGLPEFAAPLQVWSYPPGSDLRAAFEQALPGAAPLRSDAYLAPDPQAMLEAVQANPGALGYLPASWLPVDGVQTVQLDAAVQAALQQPVLALTSAEPDGALRALLACASR